MADAEPMLLTPDEVAELTDRPQPKRQIAWLIEHGWTFEVGASGLPKVLRAYSAQRLGGKSQASQWIPKRLRV